MGLDTSLIGVIGASGALFVIFCVIAFMVGCFCLRRGRKRRQQQLLEETLQEQKERSQQNSQYKGDTLNKAPSTLARSNGGDSIARSDGFLHRMSDYRPKILEDSMISNGYRNNSRVGIEEDSAKRGGNTISTIFVNENKPAEDSDTNNLDYNQSNGYIVKRYLHNSYRPEVIESPQMIIPQAYMAYGPPVGYIEDMSYVRHEREPPRHRQVFKQSVEMGRDGRLVVARSQQEHVKPDHDVPPGSKTTHDKGPHHQEEGKGSLNPVSSHGQTQAVMNQVSGEGQGQNTPQDVQGQNSTSVSGNAKEEKPDSTHPAPEGTDLKEKGDVLTSGLVHPASPKIANPDNYKVIRREHSSHSRVPEWVVGTAWVDQEISPLDSVENNDVFMVGNQVMTGETDQPYQQRYETGSTLTETGAAIASDDIYHRVAYYPGGVVIDESQKAGFENPSALPFRPPPAGMTFGASAAGDIARADDDGFAQMDFDAEEGEEDSENEDAVAVRGDQDNTLPGVSPTADSGDAQGQRVTFGAVSQYSLNSSDPPGFVSSRHGQIVDNPLEGAVDIEATNSAEPERIAHEFAFEAVVEPQH